MSGCSHLTSGFSESAETSNGSLGSHSGWSWESVWTSCNFSSSALAFPDSSGNSFDAILKFNIEMVSSWFNASLWVLRWRLNLPCRWMDWSIWLFGWFRISWRPFWGKLRSEYRTFRKFQPSLFSLPLLYLILNNKHYPKPRPTITHHSSHFTSPHFNQHYNLSLISSILSKL